MTAHPILQPALWLILWSIIMLMWMAITRFSAIGKAGVDLSNAPPGGRGQDLEGVLPASVNWKAHNYTHLMEQPTLFYALCGIVAITNLDNPLLVQLAWAYTALRVVHSIWQATVNKVPIRFGIFVISTICLAAMAVITALEI